MSRRSAEVQLQLNNPHCHGLMPKHQTFACSLFNNPARIVQKVNLEWNLEDCSELNYGLTKEMLMRYE